MMRAMLATTYALAFSGCSSTSTSRVRWSVRKPYERGILTRRRDYKGGRLVLDEQSFEDGSRK